MKLDHDIFSIVLSFLNDRDVYHLSLVNTRLHRMMSSFIWTHLYVDVGNFKHLLCLIEKGRFKGDLVKKLTINGEFERSQLKELQSIWPLVRPTELTINSSVVDFPSFFKSAVFFKYIRVLKAYENCLNWIDLNLLPELVEIWSVDHTNLLGHTQSHSFSNISKIVLINFVSDLNKEYSDYVYKPEDSQRLQKLVNKMSSPFLKEFHSYNSILGHEGVAIDFSYITPFLLPNLNKLVVSEMRQTVNSFCFLSGFSQLRYYKYETNGLFSRFESIPINTSLYFLWIKAFNITLGLNFQDIKLRHFKLECTKMSSMFKFKCFPSCDAIEIVVDGFKILKVCRNWFVFDKKWTKTTEATAFGYFIDLLNKDFDFQNCLNLFLHLDISEIIKFDLLILFHHFQS